MYVRDAKNRDEVWLLDHIEALGLDDAAFRSRDYVIAVDEETGDRAGFGRIRVHKVEGVQRSVGEASDATDDSGDGSDTGDGSGGGDGGAATTHGEDAFVEVTSVGVLEAWRRQGVGAHVLERLVEHARDEGFEEVYAFTTASNYCTQFGFEPVTTGALSDPMEERLTAVRDGEPDAMALSIPVDGFQMPDRLRDRFKQAGPEAESEEPEEDAEDFGIDPEEATYKYDI